MPLSEEEYVAKDGLVCPNCGGNDIEGQDGDFDGPDATCDAYCNTCKASWTDVYKIVRYRSLTDENGNVIGDKG